MPSRVFTTTNESYWDCTQFNNHIIFDLFQSLPPSQQLLALSTVQLTRASTMVTEETTPSEVHAEIFTGVCSSQLTVYVLHESPANVDTGRTDAMCKKNWSTVAPPYRLTL